MRPDALADLVAEDRAAGKVPFFVCATWGFESTEAFDPVAALADVCARVPVAARRRGDVRHRRAVPELRWVHDGVEAADSYCTNPHQWMGVNFDCDLLYVADRSALIDALSILPATCRPRRPVAVIDYRDWQVPLGQQFRALRVWFAMRCEGPSPTRR